MCIKSNLNEFLLTAYIDHNVRNCSTHSDGTQLWCIKFFDNGNFTITYGNAQQWAICSGSGDQYQEVMWGTYSSASPPLWNYNGSYIKAVSSGNVLKVFSNSDESKVVLDVPDQINISPNSSSCGEPSKCFSIEPISAVRCFLCIEFK